MKIHARTQSRSCAKSFTITAKPLFIGSIPIDASISKGYDQKTNLTAWFCSTRVLPLCAAWCVEQLFEARLK